LWDLTAAPRLAPATYTYTMVMPIQIYAFAMQLNWLQGYFPTAAIPCWRTSYSNSIVDEALCLKNIGFSQV
jgi:hypothetical protein